ncbi:DUF2254 family protein [Microbacterium sp. Leaf151]|uniref:DUF2254 family protein n=1 Tax=Microbacterium sp. Leaf151 TaxID=1736276 RepID=UPI0006F86EA4|nr:DUF2254 family protein [Microbacterium sp. Leaf151]
MATPTRSSLAAFFLRLGRQVWVRAAIFTVVAVVVALAADYLGPLLPFEFGIDLAQNSVGSLLQIIATAMLTVSTFSVLATVVAVRDPHSTLGLKAAWVTALLLLPPVGLVAWEASRVVEHRAARLVHA